MVYTVEELLALAEGKLIEPVKRGAVVTNVLGGTIDRSLVPCVETAVVVIGAVRNW